MPLPFRRILKKLTSRLPAKFNITRRVKTFQYADFSINERLLSYHFWSDPNELVSLFRQKYDCRTSVSVYSRKNVPVDTSDPIELALFLERNYFSKTIILPILTN